MKIFRFLLLTFVALTAACQDTMGHTYAGSRVDSSDLTLPDDGDPIDAASVNVPLEAIWDKLKYRSPVRARVYTDGLGAVNILESEGFASVALSGVSPTKKIEVTFSTPYANNNYAPVVTSLDGGARIAVVDYFTSTSAKVAIKVYDSGGTQIDPEADLVRIAIQVQGTY